MSLTRVSRSALGIASGLLLLGLARAEVATWTNLDGQQMQAEFLGRKGAYVSFRKADGARYIYPYEKLSAVDRARVDELAASGVVEEEPATAEATKPAPPPAGPPGKLVAALNERLVTLKGERLAPLPAAELGSPKFVALYYSAHWCGPCRRFTPDLVAAYREIKAAHPEFELVFVSSDRDEGSMKKYMSEAGMPWPALRYDRVDTTRAVRRPDHENGIPNLVFLDASGKELSTTYTKSGDYLGPGKVLNDIRKHFKM